MPSIRVKYMIFMDYFQDKDLRSNVAAASKTVFGGMSIMHRKCFLGQRRRPMCVHGRQERLLFSTTTVCGPTGKKPSSRTVEPKMARVGLPSAVDKCMRPESLVSAISTLFKAQADCMRVSFPARSMPAPSRFLFIADVNSASFASPRKRICAPDSRISFFAATAKRSAGHRFVSRLAPGAMQMNNRPGCQPF